MVSFARDDFALEVIAFINLDFSFKMKLKQCNIKTEFLGNHSLHFEMAISSCWNAQLADFWIGERLLRSPITHIFTTYFYQKIGVWSTYSQQMQNTIPQANKTKMYHRLHDIHP